MNPVFRFFSSLRLTVVLLAFSMVLVFFGTLDQVHWGIHETQKRYFESLYVFWQYPLEWPYGSQLRWFHLPLPGGFLLGGLLVINLACGHFRYFKSSWKKIGIILIHGGVVLLIISGFLISFYQEESQMFLDEGGEPVNFSTDFRNNELVIINREDPTVDRVTSIPQSLLKPGRIIDLPDLPLSIRVEAFSENAGAAIGPNLLKHYEHMQTNPQLPAAQKAEVTSALESLREGDALVLDDEGRVVLNKGDLPLQGFASRMRGVLQEQPLTFEQDKVNIPGAVVTVLSETGPIGSWIVSSGFGENIPAQSFSYDGKNYEIEMRFLQHYYPFWIQLQDFSHDKYPGTEIPVNFSSDIVLKNPTTSEDRKVLIYMNHPLRYAGLTFFQQSFANDDTTSILQIVRNPAWTLPYISVALVGIGMLIHFGISLVNFATKQSKKARGATGTTATT
ncbi:cytochrome c biogenesis protein ResB [Rubellicoccus peritrichatus]|uniref:Cytochrome c biogenesis protein ResB n=1 Tax=Rubellicoccus peritrichatus TaxID=3080537 RepID=A0AAQ3LCV1_9BACT|nr:cytochrome c biogenesis protein ResB [Puniceicoccus sp. CR14]WOO43461.1 cytochrome c biogenesis protein ResB [Puniceicoccus sp. CR14]